MHLKTSRKVQWCLRPNICLCYSTPAWLPPLPYCCAVWQQAATHSFVPCTHAGLLCYPANQQILKISSFFALIVSQVQSSIFRCSKTDKGWYWRHMINKPQIQCPHFWELFLGAISPRITGSKIIVRLPPHPPGNQHSKSELPPKKSLFKRFVIFNPAMFQQLSQGHVSLKGKQLVHVLENKMDAVNSLCWKPVMLPDQYSLEAVLIHWEVPFVVWVFFWGTLVHHLGVWLHQTFN